MFRNIFRAAGVRIKSVRVYLPLQYTMRYRAMHGTPSYGDIEMTISAIATRDPAHIEPSSRV